MASGAGQLAVDTYAVQHPGVAERRAVQSVAIHLIDLCAMLERQWPPERSPLLINRLLKWMTPPATWPWLAPVPPIGTVTVFDVLLSESQARHLRAWADDVWSAYEAHHATVRRWLDTILES